MFSTAEMAGGAAGGEIPALATLADAMLAEATVGPLLPLLALVGTLAVESANLQMLWKSARVCDLCR